MQLQVEVQQLREQVMTLTEQCAQLTTANAAWQSYHQTQVDALTQKLQSIVSVSDQPVTLDTVGDQILEFLNRESEDQAEKYRRLEEKNRTLQEGECEANAQISQWFSIFEIESEKSVESIRHSYTNTIDQLHAELSAMKEEYERLQNENQSLKHSAAAAPEPEESIQQVCSHFDTFRTKRRSISFFQVSLQNSAPMTDWNADELAQLREQVNHLTMQCLQLTQANQAWQEYHQSQLIQLRTKLENYFPFDENLSLDQIGQVLIDQLTQEREQFTERIQTLEETKESLNVKIQQLRSAEQDDQGLQTELVRHALFFLDFSSISLSNFSLNFEWTWQTSQLNFKNNTKTFVRERKSKRIKSID